LTMALPPELDMNDGPGADEGREIGDDLQEAGEYLENEATIQDVTEQDLRFLAKELNRLRIETYCLEECEAALETQLEEAEKTSKADKSRSRRKNKFKELTTAEKTNIAIDRHQKLKEGISQAKEATQRLVDTVETGLEALEEQDAEIRKELFEFKRAFVAGNGQTPGLSQTKTMRHFEDRLRAKEQHVDKLEVKNGVLRRKIQQSDHLISQKEGIGENLSTIDFDHLQIENQELLEKIESRNTELLALKQATGKTTLQQNTFKQALSKTTAYSVWLQEQKVQKTEQIERVMQERQDVAADLKRESRINKKLLKDQEEGTAVPPVIEYIKINMEARELRHEIKLWQQRLEVQGGAFRQLKNRVTRETYRLAGEEYGSVGDGVRGGVYDDMYR